MDVDFELCLFSVDPDLVKQADRARIDSVIVDWENKGKQRRQRGFNTQINNQGVDDLAKIRLKTRANLICRINAIGDHSEKEIEDAIVHGADEILIPMVTSLEEVEWALCRVRKRAGVGILIETNAAVDLVAQFSQFPLSRIYVGLNDLAIENGDHNIFTPVVDGRIEEIRMKITTSFGFGGLTLPHCGSPIPCRLLIGELARLDCQFSFLRRSFFADIKGKNISYEIACLKEAIKKAQERTPYESYSDHEELVERVESLGVLGARLI